MQSYDYIRQRYRPEHVKLLLVAESPPPTADIPSSRHFYRADTTRTGDRLFTNTMQALYPEAAKLSERELEQNKETWLRAFQRDGRYMIEALEESQKHEVSKQERQRLIRKYLSQLIERIRILAAPDTKIVLIKSNVFEVAAEPLRQAGFTVLNTELVDYPGRFNQRIYRQKLAKLAV